MEVLLTVIRPIVAGMLIGAIPVLGFYIMFELKKIHLKQQRIINKIIKRAKLCMYDRMTGKRFNTKLYLRATKAYDACSGKLVYDFPKVIVTILNPEYDFEQVYGRVHRNGEVYKGDCGYITKTDDGRTIFGFAPRANRGNDVKKKI